MKTLLPNETSVLASFADNPVHYSVSDLRRLVPDASPEAEDIARVLLRDEKALHGKPKDYVASIKATADALREWAEANRTVHSAPYATARR